HLVEMGNKLKEVYVTYNGREFVETLDDISSQDLVHYFRQHNIELQSGYRTEINLRIRKWLEDVNNSLSRGFLLTVDYGYSAREYYYEDRTKGTLLCYHMHLFNENPYQHIGEQDITSHVNYSSLKIWGEELGIKTLGYCPQGTFLVASGIDEVITELYSGSSDYFNEISKIKGLIVPQGLGESHSVMVQYKGEGLPELRGFSMRNQVQNL
ncbi:MAG: SAM-dependent methyltransferase, partial [Nitrospirota bacterium]